MRLIDADKIQEYLLDKYHGAISDSEMKIYQLLRLLDEQPTISAVPVVRGEWIEDGDMQICSNCGEEHSWEEYRASYCEDCGAKMESEA